MFADDHSIELIIPDDNVEHWKWTDNVFMTLSIFAHSLASIYK